MMMIYRGDFVKVNFGKPFGSEQGGVRPAIVVQNDAGNRFAPTLLVVPLTSQKKRSLPTHVSLSGSNIFPSTALCEQARVIDSSRILGYLDSCSDTCMTEIDRALSTAFGLMEV